MNIHCSNFVPQTDRWVAVNTHPHREPFALDNLERQGFEAYCPVVHKRLAHARRVTHVLRPLFPSYLFVRLAADHGWRPILSTFGVRSLVRFGNELGLLSPDFVEALRAREENGVIVRSAHFQPAEAYSIGQNVKFDGGPFDGVIATILSIKEKDRLVVLMQLLGSVPANVTADQIMPA